MLQLLFNFKIGRAQWPHLKVIRSVGWPYVPWQLGHPPWSPAVTQKAAAENGEGLRFMWQTIGLHQGKRSRWTSPAALSFMLHFWICFFFFSLLLQTALNFLLDLISSVKKCHPKGPAEVLSGPVPLKKANNLFAHKEWKKMFLCFKDYWTTSFQNESVPSSRDNFH